MAWRNQQPNNNLQPLGYGVSGYVARLLQQAEFVLDAGRGLDIADSDDQPLERSEEELFGHFPLYIHSIKEEIVSDAERPEEEEPGPLPLTHSAEQEVEAAAPTPEHCTGNVDLARELESGSEFNIIYFDDDGMLVERDLLALNNSRHLQLDLIWIKRAEQRKCERQKLQLQSESESAPALLHQDPVSKCADGSDKLLKTSIEEELPGPLPLTQLQSAEQEVGAAAPTSKTYTGNLDLDPELEGGSECNIIYFDDDGIERDLLALSAKQRKLDQQQLQAKGESTPALLQQDFVSKDKTGSGKLLETLTEEELPTQVSPPTSSAQEVDTEIDPKIGNAVVELSESESEICRCFDNKLPHDHIPRDSLERLCQVCPKHSDIFRSVDSAEEYLRQLLTGKGKQE